MTDATLVARQEEEAAGREIEDSLGGSSGKHLKLLDVAILAFLGSQIVLPIVCSFVERELWERYKKIRTRPEADEARAALAGAELKETEIEREEVVAAVVESLLDEGMPPREATAIALRTYDRIRDRA